MTFIAEQITLSKSIAERYWRIMKAPDIFWDDDLMMPVIWKEGIAEKRPATGANFWPLWTIDDSLAWIKDSGHQFLATYHFAKPEHYECYFAYGRHGKAIRIDSVSLAVALLAFIDKALKGEYDEGNQI